MPTVLERQEPKTELGESLRVFDWMRDEIDRLFGTNLTRMLPVLPQFEARWIPALDIFEKNGEMHIKADLPGLKKEDVMIEATVDGLTIKGERKAEFEERKDTFYRTERVYGEFRRYVPLPEGALLDKIDARFTDGVLEIIIPIPKLEKLTPKKVAIK